MRDPLPPHMLGSIAIKANYTKAEMDADPETVAADTIANVFAWLHTKGGQPELAVERALGYYAEEHEVI